MTGWLRGRRAGTRKRAGIRANVGCSEVACTRLEERLEALAERTGDRVVIIGQSRGGVFAKALAARRPDLVAGRRRARLAGARRSWRSTRSCSRRSASSRRWARPSAPGFFSVRCLRGECCARFRDALAGPFPPEVGYVSLYSRSDGIVDWRSCLDPAADECVEVRASHCGMSVSADAYRAIAAALRGVRRAPTRAGPQAA